MRALLPITVLATGLLSFSPSAARAQDEPLEGIRFLPERQVLYAAARPLAERMGLDLEWRAGSLFLKDEQLPQDVQRVLPDGSAAVQVRALEGLSVQWMPETKRAVLKAGELTAELVPSTTVVEGVTFAAERGRSVYVPLREMGEALELKPEWSQRSSQGRLAEHDLSRSVMRDLLDGLPLVSVEGLETVGAKIEKDATSTRATLGERTLWVSRPEKRVAISLDHQRMRAWQGRRLIFDSNISSGAKGMETPQGLFTAGPIKGRMLISRKYNNAEMPWATQVHGNVLIHGSKSVPRSPASHGCIRVPLTGRNPARWFYEWISIGTPIQISKGWPQEWPVDQPGE